MDERHPKRRKRIGIGLATVLAEVVAIRLRAGTFGGRVIVRCRAGHDYSTLWIPGASVKSLRLGLWRVQYCPVGHHWSVVTPVKLSPWRARLAGRRRDVPLP